MFAVFWLVRESLGSSRDHSPEQQKHHHLKATFLLLLVWKPCISFMHPIFSIRWATANHVLDANCWLVTNISNGFSFPSQAHGNRLEAERDYPCRMDQVLNECRVQDR